MFCYMVTNHLAHLSSPSRTWAEDDEAICFPNADSFKK